MTRLRLLLGLVASAGLAVGAPVSARYGTRDAQDGPPTAATLVEEGWTLLPPYDGEHRPFLSGANRANTEAAAHLFAAALALDEGHVRGLWSFAHAHVLLGEDRRNRDDAAGSRDHYEQAVEALTTALQLDADDPWSSYARGVSFTRLGAFDRALADLDRAVASIDTQLAASSDGGSLAWLRFKALERRPDVLMRAHRYDEARAALRSFHGEFSNNEWPLYVALAESHLRERDFAGARGDYEEIIRRFPSDHQAYALLAYVEGLLGRDERATELLTEALRRELEPGMYTRLWLWILATNEAREPADADLRGFLHNPPSRLAAWDLELGRFVIGEGTVDAFLERAHVERARRMEAELPLDDLMCEVWFYVGLRRELAAERAETDRARASLLQDALDAYARALAFSPEAWKWEWAYARLRFADLAAELELGASFDIAVEGASVRVGGLAGRAEALAWHRPRQETATASLDGAPRPGDLFLGRLRTEDGTTLPVQSLVGVR